MKYFVSIIISAVVIMIAIGLYLVGSPGQERLRRFDEIRVNDLAMTQSDIIQFWQAKKKLPANLGELNDPTRGVVVRHDPATGNEYGYQATGELSFRLCADFATSVTSSPALPGKFGFTPGPRPYVPPGPYGIQDGDNWNHGAGTVCFDRVIDPDFFPPTVAPAVKD